VLACYTWIDNVLSKINQVVVTSEWPTAWVESEVMPLPQGISPMVITFYKGFDIILYCGSSRINLSTGKNACRGKVAYIWISRNPVKAEPTLRGGGVVITIYEGIKLALDLLNTLICGPTVMISTVDY